MNVHLKEYELKESPKKLVRIIVWDPNVVQDMVIKTVIDVERYLNERCGFIVDEEHKNKRLAFIEAVTRSVNMYYPEVKHRPQLKFEEVQFLFDNGITINTVTDNTPALYVKGVPQEALGFIGAGIEVHDLDSDWTVISFSLEATFFQINVGEIELHDLSPIAEDLATIPG